jgi:hypothetical protein
MKMVKRLRFKVIVQFNQCDRECDLSGRFQIDRGLDCNVNWNLKHLWFYQPHFHCHAKIGKVKNSTHTGACDNLSKNHELSVTDY